MNFEDYVTKKLDKIDEKIDSLLEKDNIQNKHITKNRTLITVIYVFLLGIIGKIVYPLVR